MANVTVTLTVTEFYLYTDISEEESNKIVGSGMVEPREVQETAWIFDGHTAVVMQRAARLHHELALDWSGVAAVLTLMGGIVYLERENRLLRQRLSQSVTHP